MHSLKTPWILGTSFALLTLIGCGGSSPKTACTAGDLNACTGAAGCAGSQVCGSDGTYGACQCSAPGGGDAGQMDSGHPDSGVVDAGPSPDAGPVMDGGSDAGQPDGGIGASDGGGSDAGGTGDAGTDAGSGVDGGGADSGSGTDAGADAGSPDSGTPYDAGVFKFPFPPVVAFGGPILTSPKVVSVTFSGDTLAAQLDSFGTSVSSSAYWDTIRAGYCIGAPCIGDGTDTNFALGTTALAASYTDSSFGGPSTLQTFLAGLITSNKLPMPDANTIYLLYIPAATTVTLDGSQSCLAFDGYHNQMTFSGQTIVYAVVDECPAPTMTPPITLLQNTTITASHELIEGASDPIVTASGNGFTLDLTNPVTWGWADVSSIEIGDLCVDPFGLGQDETTENGFTVQRIWSIGNASAGKNPCVPVPAGEVYFSAYSEYSVVVIDVGQSKTIYVNALADGAISPWTLLAQDWSDFSNPNPNPYLDFSFPGSPDGGAQIQAQSGQSIPLKVTLVADPANAPNREADGVLVSANGTATAAHWWPFIVLTTAEAQDAGVTTMRRVQAPADVRARAPVPLAR